MLHQVHPIASHGPTQKIRQEPSMPVQAVISVCTLSEMKICPHHCDVIDFLKPIASN